MGERLNMMSIGLDHTYLPELDILHLAQTHTILRAERTTPHDGIPTFITQTGWNELVEHHHQSNETLKDTSLRVLSALERISAHLMTEAAQKTKARDIKKESFLYTLESDLFPSSSQTRLVFVKDKTHSVACALIGTPQHLRQIINNKYSW